MANMGWLSKNLTAIVFALIGASIGLILAFIVTENWVAVTAIATSLLSVGVLVAIWGVKQTKRNTNALLAVELLKDLRARETIGMLSRIYQLEPDELEPSDFRELADFLKLDIDYILYRFELLGALVTRGIMDETLAIENYAGIPAMRCWYRLHKCVKNLRIWRGYYGDNYEDFTRRSLDHFRGLVKKGRLKAINLHRQNEEYKAINLLTALTGEREPKRLEENWKERKGKQKADCTGN